MRLTAQRVEVGGAVFTLRALSSAQAAWLRAQLECADADTHTYPPEYYALQLAIESAEQLTDADGAPLELRFEPLEIWGRQYRRIEPAQWRALWHALPVWATDRLGVALLAQSYLGEPEKKDSSCTCGSASTACAAAGSSAAAPSAPDSSPTCPPDPAS